MTDYVKTLIRLARAYTRAEVAVIAAFFKQPHKPVDHLPWLQAQGFKEYSAIKPIIDALAALYPKIDNGIDRHAYAELTEKLADETKHAKLVMDLLEEIGGRTIQPKDLTWLPEDQKLAKIRARYSKSYATLLHGSGKVTATEMKRQDEELERAAITLTEGGGGALYRVCSKLKPNGIEGKIARVFHEILLDELEHKDSGARALDLHVKNDRKFARAAEIICQVSNQRLRMRNEQFGFPLNPDNLMALDNRARRTILAARGESGGTAPRPAMCPDRQARRPRISGHI